MWNHIKIVLLPISVVVILYEVKSEEDYRQAGLDLHNKLRAKHGVPPLELDDELNTLAMRCAEHYARKKRMDHSCPHKRSKQFHHGYSSQGNLGENLGSFAGSTEISKTDAMIRTTNMWYDEVKLWDFGISNAKKPGQLFDVLHFTQLVWRGTQKVGLAVVQTTEGTMTWTWVVALYGPNGNVVSQFKANIAALIQKASNA